MTNSMDRTSKNIEQSLIPEVREEEIRLLAMLQEARAEARQLVDAAQESAGRRIEEARAQLPDLIHRTREQGLEDARVRARTIQESWQEEVAILEQTARTNLPAAVRRLVTIVLPGDEA